MRGWTCRWTARTPEPTPVANGPGCGSMHALVARVLRARGLEDPSERAAFLEPKLRQLHDPSRLPDADRAAARLLDAARCGEPIVIYGDYDVDGVTATAILFRTLTALCSGANVRTYVPHRLDEGYGLNSDAVSSLAAEGARVIVSVDCGVTAVEEARLARSLGVDLIITDHHNPPESAADLPSAYAVVHPRRPGSHEPYPFADLSGAGVAYKLAWRLATMHAGGAAASPRLRDLLIDLLALAALGTIADVVPLVDENRVIARYGLSRIKHSPIIGLRALVRASGLAGEEVDAEKVGFRLAPRLNASGRLRHAREAIELFTTEDPARAEEIALRLTRLNEERRAVENAITDEARNLAEQAGMTSVDRRAIVLASPNWHAGVVGIACSRLVDRYSRPTILLQRNGEGVCHGSARSTDGFNLHAALERCAEHLERFGGHDMAAGLHVREERLPAFVESFTAIANAMIAPEDLFPRLEFDCEADAGELTPECVSQLAMLAPFGRHNPEVCVLVRGLTVSGQPRTMGAEAKHLSLRVRKGDRFFRAVGWGFGEHAARIADGSRIDAVVEPKLNTFNGRTTVEPVLRDVRAASD